MLRRAIALIPLALSTESDTLPSGSNPISENNTMTANNTMTGKRHNPLSLKAASMNFVKNYHMEEDPLLGRIFERLCPKIFNPKYTLESTGFLEVFKDSFIFEKKEMNLSDLKMEKIHPWLYDKMTNLEKLDLSGNENFIFEKEWMKPLYGKLKELCLRKYDIKNSNLEMIENFKLIEKLDLSENSIDEKTIDKVISVLSKLPNLKTLNLSENHIPGNLTTKIFTELPNLKSLDLSRNGISEFEQINDEISCFNSLESLNISQNLICGKGIETILSNFREESKLKVLILRQCGFGVSDAKQIAIHLPKFTKLEVLDLSKNYIENGINDIAAHFGKVPNLKILNLRECYIDGSGANQIAINFPSKLKVLILAENRISDGGLRAIAENVSNLRILDINENYVSAEGMKSLAENFYKMKNLVKLDLGTSTITGLTADTFVKNLHVLTNLEFLNLSKTKIEPSKIAAISGEFSKLANLKKLNLSENNFGEEGTKIFAKNIGELSRLKILNFEFNGAGDKGIVDLAKNFYKMPTLKRLNISANGISKVGVSEVLKHIKKIPFLEELDIITWLDMPGVAKMLVENFDKLKNLKRLSISYSETDEEVKLIAANFDKLEKLEAFNIVGKTISDATAEEFAKKFRRMPSLKFIYFDIIDSISEKAESILKSAGGEILRRV